MNISTLLAALFVLIVLAVPGIESQENEKPGSVSWVPRPGATNAARRGRFSRARSLGGIARPLYDSMGPRMIARLVSNQEDLPVNGSCADEIKLLCPEVLAKNAQPKAEDTGPVEEKAGQRHLFGEASEQTSLPVKAFGNFGKPTIGAFFQKFFNSTQLRGSRGMGMGLNNPGMGRPLFQCIRRRLRLRSVLPDQAEISPACKDEVRDHQEQRATDIRRDTALMTTCFSDISSLCNSTEVGAGRVLRCLKGHKTSLTGSCAAAVTARQMESAEDVMLDAPLRIACAGDLKIQCAHVGYGGGAKLSCLQAARVNLVQKCQKELFRREVEDAGDLRFNYRLAQNCASEKQKYCEDQPLGRARGITCLQDHMKEDEFGIECKSELQKILGHQAWDWRLDWRLRTNCYQDAHLLCAPEVQAAANGTASEVRRESRVLECLKEKHPQIQDEGCAKHVSRRIANAMEDMRQDLPMLQACGAELRDHCQGVPSGKGNLQLCLESVREALSPDCTQKLLDRNILQSTDFKFKPRLNMACAAERKKFCSEVTGKGLQVQQCLQDHLQDVGMSAGCRAAVQRDEVKTSGDIRLNPFMRKSCMEDKKLLCKDVQPGRGRVIACLKSKRTLLTSPSCRMAVLRSQMRAADNWKLDRPLAEQCLDDVVTHCKGVAPGDGRVHKCLREKGEEVSAGCRKEEARLEAQESEDIRLRPHLAKTCSDAMQTHCKDIHPGSGRVITCLQEKAALPEFPSQCGKVVRNLMKRSNSKAALNPRVLKSCSKEFAAQCPGMNKTEATGGIKCLVEAFQYISFPCQSEVSRTVTITLNQYMHEDPLTQVCDDEVIKYCGVDKQTAIYVQPGSVKECLTRNGGNLTAPCWKVASVQNNPIANKNHTAEIQKVYKDEITKNVVAQLEKNKNMNKSSIVLEGWPAVAMILVFGMLCASLFFLYQRYQRQSTGIKGVVYVDKS